MTTAATAEAEATAGGRPVLAEPLSSRIVRYLGKTPVYLFLAVIGAFADVARLGELGSLGVTLLLFATIIVAVHGAVIFLAAWLLRLDLATAAVASQANIVGGTSALALARSLGREDLIVPGILMGSLGNAIGTFAGFFVAAQLL